MFTEQQFSIPKLQGISEKTIEEHKKLYAGYVKNANLVMNLINESKLEGDGGAYTKGELYRRFAFEYNGMRNHEYYFKLLEANTDPNMDSALVKAIEMHWGSIENWKTTFTELAATRGIGWAMFSWDPSSKTLLMHWVDEQHLGQLQGTTPIIALDMWEHSYVHDYFPSGKKQYINDFMIQMNWKVAEEKYEAAVHTQ